MAVYSDSDFQADCSVGYLAKRVHQLAQIGLEPVFAAEGMTNIQWHVMSAIFHQPGVTPAELARDLSYDKGAMTRLLDVLERRGWIVRERLPDDRRSLRLTLTAEGERVGQLTRERLIRTWNAWLSGWSPAEVQSAVTMLQRLRDTLLDQVKGRGVETNDRTPAVSR